MPPAILLSSADGSARGELSALIAASGFTVRPLPETSPGPALGDAAAVLIVAGPDSAAAALLTRRLRAELAGDLLPIVWLLPGPDARATTLGLESGADVVLGRPIDEVVLAAQFRAAARVRAAATRLAERAAESRMLGEQLARALDQHARDHTVARRVLLSLSHRSLPRTGGVRVHVCHRPGSQGGGGFYRVNPMDDTRVAFMVGNVSGSGLTASILATWLATSTAPDNTQEVGTNVMNLNRELLQMASNEMPFVALCAGIVDTTTGELTIARAALPPPVYLPRQGEPTAWEIPGPVLGVTEVSIPTHRTRLEAGAKLVVGSDGLRTVGGRELERTHFVRAVAECRDLGGQQFIDSVAAKILSEIQHEADVTLLSVEFRTDVQAV